MDYFNIDHILFKLLNYEVSYLEFWSILTGFAAVFYAAKNNLLTWWFAILNAILLFSLFFQFQLYADMLLQLYFLGIAIYGLLSWKEERALPITNLSSRFRFYVTFIIILIWPLLSEIISRLHLFFPAFFEKPASYPYADSLIMLLSIIAQFLLTKRKIDNWYLWIFVNVLGITVYGLKGIFLLSIQYVIFLILAISGLREWKKLSKNQNRENRVSPNS